MYPITVLNVNQALPIGMELLRTMGANVAPRGLATIEHPGPVATTYERPWECVLFDPVRDANPFFHLMEAMWILRGREDVAFLKQFNSRITQYSDDGVTFNAPYGQRLRNWRGSQDQIAEAVMLLKKDVTSRQVVLQIWNPTYDFGTMSKDKACNTAVALLIRDGRLRMTVFNRSNDVVWGAYGANVVQFSVLQIYMAYKIGVGVGPYTQISNSYHVYEDNPFWVHWMNNGHRSLHPNITNYYMQGCDAYLDPRNVNFGSDFEEDLERFFHCWDRSPEETVEMDGDGPFFNELVLPMYRAHWCWTKQRHGADACTHLDAMPECDWQRVARMWLHRRITRAANMQQDQV